MREDGVWRLLQRHRIGLKQAWVLALEGGIALIVQLGFPHGSVKHSAKQYVVGAIHTNTIEGFWSLFKRSIVGSYHKVSAKYLPLYIAEAQFKYNNRKNADIFGLAIAGL